MGKRIIRWLFSILGGVVGYGLMLLATSLFKLEFEKTYYELACYAGAISVFLLLFYLLSNTFISKVSQLIDRLDSDIRKLSLADMVLGTVGILIGLGISYIVANIISKINIPILAGILSVLAYITIILICVSIALRRKEDLKLLFKGYRDKEDELKCEKIASKKKILDTSVIIDGRIYDVLKTGFVDGDLIVPSFVLEELQTIADSADSLKRERGRRGLDILNHMTHDFPDQVRIADYDKDKQTAVDMALLEVTQKEKGVVMTNDYNLNKVAKVKDIKVLNINDLSSSLRPIVLPGESFDILVIKEGKEAGQGLGFLNDGTMVVIEDGKKLIDTTQHVEVTSILQTSAGRMIFTRVVQ